MQGDEALGRVACDARADIRLLFGEDNTLLPVHAWPANVAQSVKSIRPGAFGISITMNDSLTARRVILEVTGKLKNPLNGDGDLAAILGGNFPEGA